MKIKSYALYQVPPRWLFLKLETDEGVTGWGEPIAEGKAATVKTAVNEMMETCWAKTLCISKTMGMYFTGALFTGAALY